MKVPETVKDFNPELFMAPGSDAVSWMEWRPELIRGRFVPDDLLRARFAFEGHKVVDENAVVLSREEAEQLATVLRVSGAYKCWVEMLQSKLPAEQPKEKP